MLADVALQLFSGGSVVVVVAVAATKFAAVVVAVAPVYPLLILDVAVVVDPINPQLSLGVVVAKVGLLFLVVSSGFLVRSVKQVRQENTLNYYLSKKMH